MHDNLGVIDMYIDANLRAAKLPARTPESRFGTRPLASSLVAHAAIAVALVFLAHRTMLPMPVETPPIPMIFLPPEPAPVAPPQTQPEPAQTTPPEPVVRQPEPPPPEPPPPPPVPEVAPAPPPPVVREPPPPPPPRREPQVRRVPTHPRPVRREPEPTPATPTPLAPPITAPTSPAAPAAPPVAVETGPVVPPRPLSEAAGNRPPNYPESAKQRGEQGRAVLRVDVTVDGRAAAVSVLRSTGFPRLDQSAVDAVRGWRFIPATRGGRPVAAIAEVPVNFQLASE